MEKLNRLIAAAFLSLVSVTGCIENIDDPIKEDKTDVERFGEDFFTKYTDPVSGVVTYMFKNEAVGIGPCNTQGNYFNGKSMTDDGRFFFFFFSSKEKNGNSPAQKGGCVMDLEKRKLITFNGSSGCYPYLDPKEDKLYYFIMGAKTNSGKVRDNGYFMMKDLKKGETVRLADFPSEIAPKGCYIQRALSHITLTQDKKKVFIDAAINDVFYQGLLDLYTGEWTEWNRTSTVHLTHGQLNPTRDDEALLAIDVWDKSDGEKIPIEYDPDGTYPRIQLMKPDGTRRTIKPSENNYATHEGWCADGNTIYFCAGMHLPNGEYSGGFHFRNVRTNDYTVIPVERSTHGNPTKDLQYFVHDDDRPWGEYKTGYYRGGPWRVWFYNRKTGKDLAIFSGLKPITTPDKPSTIHPDPHPHFVCNDKYVICSASDNEDGGNGFGYLHVCITPVDQLIKLSSK
ncbi:MAG: hypothetical protein J5737_06665 [Bacteroidales bacterium]|nr:hypothetical protein [Bacteroidales bacterium]